MALTVEIVGETPQAEKEYDAFLDQCRHSVIQQSTTWRDVIAALGPDEPYLLLAREADRPVGALPLYLYKGKYGNIMTSVPQPGPHGGITAAEDVTDQDGTYRSLINAALELSREKSCCILSIITNPFLQDAERCRQYLQPEYALENFTQYIPLNEIFDADGVAGYQKKRTIVKRKLMQAESAGLEVREGSEKEFGQWYDIHERRHREVGAQPLERGLFQNIIEKALPLGHAKFLLVYYNEKVIGGCIYICNRHICDAFLMSADSEYIELGTNYVLTHAALTWAYKTGRQIFNWQSSPSRQSGVYEFKRKWDSKEVPYYFYSRVVGDIEPILNGAYHEVRSAYKNHFILPVEINGEVGTRRFGEFVKHTYKKP